MNEENRNTPEYIGHGLPDDSMLNCTYSPLGGTVAVG